MYFAHEIEFRTQALHECKLLLGVFPHAFPQATNPYSLRQLRASTLIKLRKNRSISLAHSRFIHGLSLARSISLAREVFRFAETDQNSAGRLSRRLATTARCLCERNLISSPYFGDHFNRCDGQSLTKSAVRPNYSFPSSRAFVARLVSPAACKQHYSIPFGQTNHYSIARLL
jgi:hypothetical protein